MPPSLANETLPEMKAGMGFFPGAGVLDMERPGFPVLGAPGAGASKIDPNQNLCPCPHRFCLTPILIVKPNLPPHAIGFDGSTIGPSSPL
ncbi:hypothetical protein AMTRI_Chr05g68820 [Amborella trichopoda]